MRYTFFILVLFYFSCSDRTSNTSQCFNYPPKIEALNSRDLYDSSRWILFNWLGYKQIDKNYYGQMELRFKNVLLKNDTIEIFFIFYSPDSLVSKNKKSIPIAQASVAFKNDTKKRLWAFVYPFEDFSDGLEPGNKELDSPPSEKAIKFLNSHKDSLNACYLELAQQLKFLN